MFVCAFMYDWNWSWAESSFKRPNKVTTFREPTADTGLNGCIFSLNASERIQANGVMCECMWLCKCKYATSKKDRKKRIKCRNSKRCCCRRRRCRLLRSLILKFYCAANFFFFYFSGFVFWYIQFLSKGLWHQLRFHINTWTRKHARTMSAKSF